VLLHEITDHQKTKDAVPKEDGFIVMPNGRKMQKCTTKGWELLVEWKDRTTTWVLLKDIKDTNPVEVAEYAFTNQIKSEPAFAWWVNTVMKKRDRIIAKLQKK
jgi:hypothetical protein